jgi:hypothetical protein
MNDIATPRASSERTGGFDLSPIAAWTDHAQRFGRWVLSGFAVFAIAFEAVVAVTRLGSGDYGSATIFLLSVGGILVFCGGAGVRFFALSPVRATVGPRGIEIGYPDGRLLRYRWVDRRLRIRIRAWRDHRRLAVDYPYVHEFLVGGLRASFGISPELFDAILSAAKANGAVVNSDAGFDAAKSESVDFTITQRR